MAAVTVKICGLNDAATVDAAVKAGADMIGFVFYPPSPRAVSTEAAAALAARVPPSVQRVGLFVDAEDALLQQVLSTVPLEWLQLHGNESPERCREIAGRWGQQVMKAFRLRTQDDLTPVADYTDAVDQALFDAKPPDDMTGSLPGGNGVAFDWRLLQGYRCDRPWMLSGGLTVESVAAAITATGAVAVDVSTGVEDRPGKKNISAIERFVKAAKLPVPA